MIIALVAGFFLFKHFISIPVERNRAPRALVCALYWLAVVNIVLSVLLIAFYFCYMTIPALQDALLGIKFFALVTDKLWFGWLLAQAPVLIVSISLFVTINSHAPRRDWPTYPPRDEFIKPLLAVLTLEAWLILAPQLSWWLSCVIS